MNEHDPTSENASERQPAILPVPTGPAPGRPWNGAMEGKDLGTDVTVLFYATDEVGIGSGWHFHPYDEVFIVRAGRALFTIGERKIEAEAGDILLGPAHLPHKYHNLGPDRLETTDIHLSDRWIQTDLEDPELAEK